MGEFRYRLKNFQLGYVYIGRTVFGNLTRNERYRRRLLAVGSGVDNLLVSDGGDHLLIDDASTDVLILQD